MKKSFIVVIAALLIVFSCTVAKKEFIENMVITQIIDSLSKKSLGIDKMLIEKGVTQVAEQWREIDGDSKVFEAFCYENFMSSPQEKEALFNKLSVAGELINGHFSEMSVGLKKPLHLDIGPLTQVDYIFGGYEPTAHFKDDMYNNKIAYITILNFPFFELSEKDKLGGSWDRLEWAYARVGDMYTPQPPAHVNQIVADAGLKAESYISEYNIMAGLLVNDKGEKLFPLGMKLLTHWNLRDEIKSNYAVGPQSLEKQKMLYEVMLRIIDQSIPKQVINNDQFEWDPYKNTIKKEGVEVDVIPEGGQRYTILLEQFRAQKELDKFVLAYPTAIKRAFDGQMQISVEEIEQMFKEFMTSSKIKDIATIIKDRLGRQLEAYDIWYDGFKSRSSISQESLDAITTKRYPNAGSFDADIPNILKKLGFSDDKALWFGNAITVEAARGSGHAQGAMSKIDVARLRTRLSPNGMDYKGFNIAIHELGHNIEQTISMRNIDYYFLNGVPNTAFTEANAFVFQKRDLKILGFPNLDSNQKEKTEMDIQWGAYEIMGVSLVDINVWRWMYDNPQATSAQLQTAVIDIAIEVWNEFFAPVIGVKDSPILAIYSHMINYPLYLANYPFGHIIEYQLEKHYEGKDFAKEVERIYTIGNITPQQWMLKATGEKISVKAMID